MTSDDDTPPPLPDSDAIDFEDAYADTPPWDIGRPQEPFLAVARDGTLRGRVLDVGCGTGEHVLLAAEIGADATGVDTAPTAIAIAQRKAAERGLTARFLIHDALDLTSLGERFDVVIDSGLFHGLSDADRPRFADSLRAALAAGGTYLMLCFSDRAPGTEGPRRISQREIRETFAEGFRVDAIETAYLESTLTSEPIPGWLATITRPCAA